MKDLSLVIVTFDDSFVDFRKRSNTDTLLVQMDEFLFAVNQETNAR